MLLMARCEAQVFLNLFDAALADAADLAQPFGVLVQHGQALEPEGSHDAFGETGTDAVNQARPEVLLQTGERARSDRHQRLDAELLAVFGVGHEFPGDAHARAGPTAGNRAYRGQCAAPHTAALRANPSRITRKPVASFS